MENHTPTVDHQHTTASDGWPYPSRPRRRGPSYGGPARHGYPSRNPSRLEALEDEVQYLRELVEWLEAVLAAGR